jgi:hypothetical protein
MRLTRVVLHVYVWLGPLGPPRPLAPLCLLLLSATPVPPANPVACAPPLKRTSGGVILLCSQPLSSSAPCTLSLSVLQFYLFPPLHTITYAYSSFYSILSHSIVRFSFPFSYWLFIFKLRFNILIYTSLSTLCIFNLTYADQGLQSSFIFIRTLTLTLTLETLRRLNNAERNKRSS